VLIALLLIGCLERVTGEAVPLDPRFVANQPGAPGAEGGGAGGGQTPFSDHDGDMVWVRGEIVAADAIPVDLDVRIPDQTAPGGSLGLGKILLEGPGSFELEVPKELGLLELQAFQDPDGDGPSEGDAFGEVLLEVGAEDLTGVLLTLAIGARGGPAHVEAAPGEGNDQAPPPSGEHSQDSDPFEGMDGPFVLISGTIEANLEVMVDLDLFQTDPTVPGGRKLLGKLKRYPGPFELQVPAAIGSLQLEAMVDLDGDGPSASDPQARYSGNPIDLTEGAVSGVLLSLTISEGAAPAPMNTGSPENLSLDEEFAATEEAAGKTEGSEAP
jgi:hypothetical protein